MQKQYTQKSFKTKQAIAYPILFSILVGSLLMGVSIGTVKVPVTDSIKLLFAELIRKPIPESVDPMYQNIVMTIRMPRVVLSGLVGASLAVTGAAFQGLLRNPLADPYTLGVSSGASVGAVMTIFFNLTLPWIGKYTLPVISIIFALITIFIVLFFSRRIDHAMRVETIILTGIIFSSFLGAFISLMIALTGEELRQIIGWLLGSVSMRGWEYVGIILPFFLIGSFILIIQASELNAMLFGEEQAKHLGVQVQKKKIVIMIAGSILTGAAVAVSGTIGFVGLVIPHLIRIILGPDHKHLLPLSILAGASFLIVADLVSRIIIAPSELPIGVITALIGAPVFAVILMKQRLKGRS